MGQRHSDREKRNITHGSEFRYARFEDMTNSRIGITGDGLVHLSMPSIFCRTKFLHHISLKVPISGLTLEDAEARPVSK